MEFYSPPSSEVLGSYPYPRTYPFLPQLCTSNLCPLPLQENSQRPVLLSRPLEALPLPWTPVPSGAWAPGHWLPPGLSVPPPVVCRLLYQKPAVPLHPFPGKMNSTVYQCTTVSEREEEDDNRVERGRTESMTYDPYALCILLPSLGFDPGTSLRLPTHGPLPTCPGSRPVLTTPLSGESQEPSPLPRT